jgi:hypothetical protein
MPKIVYTVRGNHDGILGVYGNIKAAFEKAMSYVNNGEEKPVTWKSKWTNGRPDGEHVPATYKMACAELKRRWNFDIASDPGEDTNANIEKFELNR